MSTFSTDVKPRAHASNFASRLRERWKTSVVVLRDASAVARRAAGLVAERAASFVARADLSSASLSQRGAPARALRAGASQVARVASMIVSIPERHAGQRSIEEVPSVETDVAQILQKYAKD